MVPLPAWNIIEHRGRAGLERLEADWRRLYAEMPLRTSFLAYEACLAHVDHVMAAPDQLNCLALTDGRRVRAICALEPRTDRALGLGLRVWGVLRHEHGSQADVLCTDDEARRAFVPAVVAHLRRRPEGRRLLIIGPAPASSALWDGLRALDGGRYHVASGEIVSELDCRMPFDQLRASLPRWFRHDLNRERRRLEKLRDVKFVNTRDGADLASEFATFLDVEASGWKGEGGERTALRFRGGLLEVFRSLATDLRGEVDHCEINALYAEERCIASFFGTRTGATLSGLKIGYDEAYLHVSPGHLLVEKIVERCCDDPGIERFDMVSESTWARGWRPERIQLQRAFVPLGGWPGYRIATAMLRLRFGPARRFARWLLGKRAANRRKRARRDSSGPAGRGDHGATAGA